MTPDLLEQILYESCHSRNTLSGCLSQKITTVLLSVAFIKCSVNALYMIVIFS